MLAALPAELDWAGHPTVLVVEDVHWADEATLDVLGYLARRIAELPAVLVLTYRDDELTREHPCSSSSGRRRPRAGSPPAVAAPVGGRGPTVERDQPGRCRPGVRRRRATRSLWPRCSPPGMATGSRPRRDAVLGRVRAWTRPPRMRWSSWPWFRPWWSGGWSTWWRAGWPRWRRPRARPAGGVAGLGGVPARAGAPGGGGLGAGGAPGGAEPAGAAGPGRAGGRRPVAHRPPRGSRPATATRSSATAAGGRTRPAPAPTVRRSPTIGWCSVTGAVRPGRAGRAAGGVRRRVLHDRDRRAHARRPARGNRAAPVAGRPARLGADLRWLSRMAWWAGIGPPPSTPARRRSPCWRRPATAGCSPWPSATSPAAHAGLPASDCVAVGERAVALARELGDAAILSHALLNVGSARQAARRSGGLVADGGEPAGRAGRRRGRARLPRLRHHHLDLLDDLRLDDAERKLAEGMRLAEQSDHLGSSATSRWSWAGSGWPGRPGTRPCGRPSGG